ncbi:hypothetical protein VTN77DRAFT_1771 [Rasamsonia byssochlamydoides]|uniref:uncharacterized protein n=1 Tax=Rasamsonia byssochlamydoides TaxID=89139 RepID=UPI00374430F7
MQIPYLGTEGFRRSERAKQAESELGERVDEEIEALEYLRGGRCTSAPRILVWKQEKQGDNLPVLGGWMAYILTEHAPGIRLDVDNIDIHEAMDRQERDELRRAFKNAWLECEDCGVTHGKRTRNSLVWNRERQKCSIVDWEVSGSLMKGTDGMIQSFWHTAWQGTPPGDMSRVDRNDMSTWLL